MKLFVAGASHRTTPVELRGRLAVPAESIRTVGLRLTLLGGLSEVVILSTCNRIEIYGVTLLESVDARTIFRLVAPSVHEELDSHLYLHEGADAVRHLLEVVSGIDSIVLGETEIVGQVRHAYEAAKNARLTAGALNTLFQKALQTAKEVRTETRIGAGHTSTGSVVLALTRQIFGERLDGLAVTVIGAGSMAATCVRHLTKHGASSVVVCNRSLDHAEELAAEFGGRAARLEERYAEMAEAQIVVAMTGSTESLVNAADIEKVMKARRHRPLFLVDLSVPRNIDPAVRKIDGVYLYDMDDLGRIVAENLKDREADLARCREIIERKNEALVSRFQALEERNRAGREPAPEPEVRCVFSGLALSRG